MTDIELYELLKKKAKFIVKDDQYFDDIVNSVFINMAGKQIDNIKSYADKALKNEYRIMRVRNQRRLGVYFGDMPGSDKTENAADLMESTSETDVNTKQADIIRRLFKYSEDELTDNQQKMLKALIEHESRNLRTLANMHNHNYDSYKSNYRCFISTHGDKLKKIIFS